MIVSSAGGTAWALVFRTVSSPVGLREALRIYRREQTGKVMASTARPAARPGRLHRTAPAAARVSTWSACQRSFPATTSMIVADGRCATVSWVPITQHTEATTVCDATDGALTVPRLVTDESIAGSTTTSTVRLPGDGLPAAAGGPAGRALGAPPARSASPAEKVVLAGEELGPATMVVGGHTVSVEHTRSPSPSPGPSTGPTRPTSGSSEQRPHRARAGDGRVTQGGVRYNENMDATLTGLDPAR